MYSDADSEPMTETNSSANEEANGYSDAQISEQAAENFDGEVGEDEEGQRELNTSVLSKKSVSSEDRNVHMLPTKGNPLYNTSEILDQLDRYPTLKIRRDGKYYMKMKDAVTERHPKVRRNSRGEVIPTVRKEVLGPIEQVISRFCEDVLCISRAMFLPLSSQGERHLIWVGKKKANHIIRHLNGNGCYIVNRFPGDIFLKDKQVMGVTLRQHMLMRSNICDKKCGTPKDDILGIEEEEVDTTITYRMCRHMVKGMVISASGCEDKNCYNFEKSCCEHIDVFVPEVQSFCTYNALQEFSNRLNDDLKGQTFVCKPAYLYKGYGFRFFRQSEEFQEFYHMTEGKETSRHDFMVQRLVDRPFLHNGRKVDIRAFLLVIVLRHRRVVSFVHYGFCRIAPDRYEEIDEEAEDDIEDVTEKERERRKAESLEMDMRMMVCTYKTKEEKQLRKKLMDSNGLLEDESDRSLELSTVFVEEEQLLKVQEQIRHIGIRITESIENKVWDWFGCFQIFSMDLCVNEDLKVWLIEVNSHAVSEVDTISPTQRKVVPAVIMEAIGLVMETVYKSFHHMRLRKNPENEFEETGFIFRQNYDFVFSTLTKKRMDYVWPKPQPKKNLPYYERIGVVDQQIKNVEKRKRACQQMRQTVQEEQLALKRKREAKNDEES